jgi:hypothetical protein
MDLALALVEEDLGRDVALEIARVQAARQALADAADGVDAVAARCGFGTAETMRRAFHCHLGIGPADYRARFSSALQPAMPGPTTREAHADLQIAFLPCEGFTPLDAAGPYQVPAAMPGAAPAFAAQQAGPVSPDPGCPVIAGQSSARAACPQVEAVPGSLTSSTTMMRHQPVPGWLPDAPSRITRTRRGRGEAATAINGEEKWLTVEP